MHLQLLNMKNPKKKIEIIFYLIKRMHSTQKRHFKLSNQMYKGRDKDFVRLFDFINKLPIYDIKEIETFFAQKKVKNKNLCISYLLNKLIDNIDDGTLDFIDNGRKEIVPRMKTLRTYAKVGLMDLAYKEILKIEQIAVKYDLFEYLYFVYSVWNSMIDVTYLNKREIEQKDELHSKRKKLAERTSVNEDITHARYIFSCFPPDSQRFKDAHKLLVKYEKYDFSPLSEAYYNHALYWYSLQTRAYKSAFKYCQNYVNIYAKNPDYIGTLFDDYIANWHNLLMAAIQSEDKETIEKYFEIYRKLPQRFSKVFSLQSNAIIGLYTLLGYKCETDYSINSEQYENIIHIHENVLKMLKKYPMLTSRGNVIIGLFLRLSYGFILLRNRARAEFWLDKISDLHYEDTNHAPNVIVMELIIHYEKKSLTLLKSRIRSLKRKWKTDTKLSESVLFMVNLLSSLMISEKQKKLPEAYKAAHQKILKIEHETNYYISYSKWIAQKM